MGFILQLNLNRRIRIESKSATQETAFGTETVTWGTHATVWAEVRDELPSKSEAVKEGLRVATKRIRIRIRYLATVTSDMRIVLLDRGNAVLQLVAPPAEIGRKEYMELMCENYTTAGTGG